MHKELESVEGAKYALVFSAHKQYHFKNKGNTPKELEGSFSGLRDAKRQWELYNIRLTDVATPKRVDIEDDVKVEDLNTKVELLSFAEKWGIPVPSGLSNPKQIKKMIKDLGAK